MFSLTCNSDGMIDLKVKEISARFKWLALIAGGMGSVLMPGLSAVTEKLFLNREIVFQKVQLGIDEKSIHKKSSMVGSNKENNMKNVINEIVKVEQEASRLLDNISKGMTAGQIAALTGVTGVGGLIGIIGVTISGGITARSVYAFLQKLVKAHAKIAKTYIQV